MKVYYNEINPTAVLWLQASMDAGVIPTGDIDTRSIEDVRPTELMGYTQCHFFAGIGGWSIALRLAGWPDDRPVWTGSCPCQSFSTAGKGLGIWAEVEGDDTGVISFLPEIDRNDAFRLAGLLMAWGDCERIHAKTTED